MYGLWSTQALTLQIETVKSALVQDTYPISFKPAAARIYGRIQLTGLTRLKTLHYLRRCCPSLYR